MLIPLFPIQDLYNELSYYDKNTLSIIATSNNAIEATCAKRLIKYFTLNGFFE